MKNDLYPYFYSISLEHTFSQYKDIDTHMLFLIFVQLESQVFISVDYFKKKEYTNIYDDQLNISFSHQEQAKHKKNRQWLWATSFNFQMV